MIGHKQPESVVVACAPTQTVVAFTTQTTQTRVIVSDHLNSYPTLSLIRTHLYIQHIHTHTYPQWYSQLSVSKKIGQQHY